tara:strand:- start:4227 stop:4844 length:618 start_codon:yes stop_codon:yes gene_type:complete
MIDDEHKVIFIHIPKCGGTSIELVFKPEAARTNVKSKHANLAILEESDFEKYQSYYKFSFVRNPWDLTVSMYRYLWLSDLKGGMKWRKKNPEYAKLSFEEWLKHPYFQTPNMRMLDIGREGRFPEYSFLDWITADNFKMDFIGRFENLQEDFDVVCDNIGIPKTKLSHINNTNPGKHYTEYYTDETKNIVGTKYAKDIEYFGYEF